jgi:HEAT repeat protein
MPLIRKTQETAGSEQKAIAVDNAADIAALSHSGVVEDRWAAARAMAARHDVPALSHALATESNARIRTAILTGLAQIATPESADAVIPYLRSEDAKIRTEALDALRAMADAVKPRLPALLADADADVRLLACEVVRNVKGADAEVLLCNLLIGEESKNVCSAAIEVLAEIGTEAALPSLAQCSARFTDDAFLGFAISVAANRLRARSAP